MVSVVSFTSVMDWICECVPWRLLSFRVFRWCVSIVYQKIKCVLKIQCSSHDTTDFVLVSESSENVNPFLVECVFTDQGAGITVVYPDKDKRNKVRKRRNIHVSSALHIVCVGSRGRPNCGSGPCFNIETVFRGMGISIIKPMLEISMLVRWRLYIETATDWRPSMPPVWMTASMASRNMVLLTCTLIKPSWMRNYIHTLM